MCEETNFGAAITLQKSIQNDVRVTIIKAKAILRSVRAPITTLFVRKEVIFYDLQKGVAMAEFENDTTAESELITEKVLTQVKEQMVVHLSGHGNENDDE